MVQDSDTADESDAAVVEQKKRPRGISDPILDATPAETQNFQGDTKRRGRNGEGGASVLWVETVEARRVGRASSAGRQACWNARSMVDGYRWMGKENRRRSLRIIIIQKGSAARENGVLGSSSCSSGSCEEAAGELRREGHSALAMGFGGVSMPSWRRTGGNVIWASVEEVLERRSCRMRLCPYCRTGFLPSSPS